MHVVMKPLPHKEEPIPAGTGAKPQLDSVERINLTQDAKPNQYRSGAKLVFDWG